MADGEGATECAQKNQNGLSGANNKWRLAESAWLQVFDKDCSFYRSLFLKNIQFKKWNI